MYTRGCEQDTSMVRAWYEEGIRRAYGDIMFINHQNNKEIKIKNRRSTIANERMKEFGAVSGTAVRH